MALVARQSAREFSTFEVCRAAVSAVGGLGLAAGQRDGLRPDPAARSVGTVALVALLSLPHLLLASMSVGAPLVVPAVIAIGYFPIAAALAAGRNRRATAMTLALLAALVVLPPSLYLASDAAQAPAGIAAALLASMFAAGPALVRGLIAQRVDAERITGAASSREEVGHTTVAARPDFPAGAKRPPAAPSGTAAPASRLPATVPCPPPEPACDVNEAARFALRNLAPRLQEKGIRLICDSDGAAAACDQQLGRRILHRLLRFTAETSAPGAEVRMLVRTVRGAVLLRTRFPEAAGPALSNWPAGADIASIEFLVETAGGSMVAERSPGETVLSVRLPRAGRIRGAG